eukprot:PLAT10358.1.p1 GENE.PLAT10358.1~~PLAT10358.1.p1  ORF type:complete len:827 (+),score=416.82 PLAT10358.1:55-2481(+)
MESAAVDDVHVDLADKPPAVDGDAPVAPASVEVAPEAAAEAAAEGSASAAGGEAAASAADGGGEAEGSVEDVEEGEDGGVGESKAEAEAAAAAAAAEAAEAAEDATAELPVGVEAWRMWANQRLRRYLELAAVPSPEEEPYKSFYRCRRHLQRSLDTLSTGLQACGDDGEGSELKRALRSIEARMHSVLASNYVDTQENYQAEQALSSALAHYFPATRGNVTQSTRVTAELAEEHRAGLMNALMQSGILWGNRSQYSRALGFYRNALATFRLLRPGEPVDSVAPFGDRSVVDVLAYELDDVQETQSLQSMLTRTLFCLAQVYAHLGRPRLSAKYCHLCLTRQLATGEGYDAAEWVQNAVNLSDYYRTTRAVRTADYCLRAAAAVAARDIGERVAVTAELLEATSDSEAEKLARLYANVDRGQALLLAEVLREAFEDAIIRTGGSAGEAFAEERLRQAREEEEKQADMLRLAVEAEEAAEARSAAEAAAAGGDADAAAAVEAAAAALDADAHRDEVLEPPPPSRASLLEEAAEEKLLGDVESVTFHGLSLADSKAVVAADVVGFDSARALFKRCNAFVTRALAFYVLDGFVTDHIHLLQLRSRIYRYLAQFETSVARRIAMHKRRVALYLPLMTELNPSVYDWALKQLSFEMGEAFSEMSDIKTSQIEEQIATTGTSKASSLRKNCEYISSAIFQFRFFIARFAPRKEPGKEERDADGEPELSSTDDMQAFLRAHFNVARCLTRCTEPEREKTVTHLVEALKCYRWLVDFGERNAEKLNGTFAAELAMCKDMIGLLPMKIDRLIHGHFA